jgi:transcriptional regulator with XRE-family HTH domain
MSLTNRNFNHNKFKKLFFERIGNVSAEEFLYIKRKEGRLKLSRGTLYNWLTGNATPSMSRFLELCDILGCSAESFFEKKS